MEAGVADTALVKPDASLMEADALFGRERTLQMRRRGEKAPDAHRLSLLIPQSEASC
jgi:hypothetical protein